MIKLADNGQGDLTIVMQDPQEMPAEQQVANQQETTNTQAANAEQVVNNGEQQVSAQAQAQQTSVQAQSSSESRITELEAQLAQACKEATDNWNRYVRERADVD